MLILNGTEVYDFTSRDYEPLEITSNVHPLRDLALMMDGTTASLDSVHKIAPTRTGGVGNVWPGDASNFRDVLCARAPVIAEATDNLDANADCIFTPFVGVTWAPINGAATSASTETEGYGSSSMLITCGVNVDGGAQLACVTVAAQPYTCSCRVRANNAGAVGEVVRINFDGTTADVTLTANWQTLAVTDAAASGVAINAQIYFTAGENGDEVLVSMWQRENKTYKTPFALDSRTACRMSFPTASLGITAGQPLSIVVVTKTPWAGNDGVTHVCIDARIASGAEGWFIIKEANRLYFYTILAWANKNISGPVTAVNWPADTTHIIIATADAANNQQIFLNGTPQVTVGGAAAREASINANLFIGTDRATATPWNGPQFVAIYNRVISANEIALLSRMGAWCQRMKGF